MELLELLEKDPKKYLQILDKLEFDDDLRLIDYIKLCWAVLEPGTRFVPGWHMEAICEHLEAINKGEITRTLFTVPPGSSKSLITSVFFPTWEWGPKKSPYLKHLCFSYAKDLGIRDNLKARRLIESDLYQKKDGVMYLHLRQTRMPKQNLKIISQDLRKLREPQVKAQDFVLIG